MNQLHDAAVARLEQLLTLRANVDQEIDQQRIRIHSIQEAKRAHGVIEATAHWHSVQPADLISKQRGQWVSAARHVAMWLLRESGMSYPDIGRALGGRDHTTAIWGVKRVETTPALRATALRIQSDLERRDRGKGAA